ncbi:MAG: hypothetical protein AB8B56_06185 [Crocinitomicaceae bacterium]
MRRLPTLIALVLFCFSMNSQAQDNSKLESVKVEIDKIIDNIHMAADTIEHIDQINAIYDAGSYVKLKNLIDYYKDLGGPKEQVDKYQVHHKVLGDRLQTRKHNIDVGNIIDLKYQAEVETDIQDLTTQLKSASPENIHSIRRDYELLQKIFDLRMEHNTVVGEWKEITRERLIQLKKSVDAKSEELKK